MTEAERAALDRAYTALMKRVRALSARTSTAAIRSIDASLASLRATLGGIATSGSVLDIGKANELINTLNKGLSRVAATWTAEAQGATRSIVAQIVSEARVVHFRAAAVADLETGGIALDLSTVPTVVRAAVPFLRDSALADNIAGHADEITDAIRDYIKGATGVSTSAEAARGIDRLLRGKLPVDLGGVSLSDAKLAASLPWKVERSLVTTSFETYRQATAASLKAAPLDLVAHWDLSPRHVVEDDCDDVANADVGYGPGWYPPEEWPAAPHPNCQCGQGDIRTVGDGD